MYSRSSAGCRHLPDLPMAMRYKHTAAVINTNIIINITTTTTTTATTAAAATTTTTTTIDISIVLFATCLTR